MFKAGEWLLSRFLLEEVAIRRDFSGVRSAMLVNG
jgi:hypothetical protein